MSKSKTQQVAVKGDCVVELRKRPNESYQLGICDPPYSFGMPYDSYDDHKGYHQYMDWTKNWIEAVKPKLTKEGSLWVFCPDEWVSEIDMLCRHAFKFYKQRHVVWAFTFGQRAQRNFTRSHCHLLWLTKHRTKYTFNFDAVRVPSARQLVYNDKRAVAGGKPPDATWMLLREQMEPWMGSDRDTWMVSRICGTFKERKKHCPNQIPLPIMARIVLATSNSGDRVLDPFCGTGSSGVACANYGRHWDGYDLSPIAVRESNKRIAAVND